MMPAGATFGGKHTYQYFHMIPKSKIIFAPPKPKTTIVDIPNADGQLDYTEALSDSIKYENRKGTISFLVLTGADYTSVYSEMLTFFNGKKMRVVLDDDPLYYYEGRFAVNEWKSWEGRSTIALDYDLEPYKYAVSSTSYYDWLWDDLFDNVIYYGSFDVEGTKARNLINPSGRSLVPTFTCSSAMTVDFNGSTYSLSAGTHSGSTGIVLRSGNNYMTFHGNGRVLVDYSLEKSL